LTETRRDYAFPVGIRTGLFDRRCRRRIWQTLARAEHVPDDRQCGDQQHTKNDRRPSGLRQNVVLERDPLGVIFLEPFFSGIVPDAAMKIAARGDVKEDQAAAA
jgi:hypothetical protein